MRRSQPAAETSATASASRTTARQPQCAETRQRRAARGSGILRRHRYLTAPASNAGLAGGDEESRASFSAFLQLCPRRIDNHVPNMLMKRVLFKQRAEFHPPHDG